ELEVSLPRVGLHDVRNAAGVLALLGEMGYDIGLAAQGLTRFGGVSRRFEDRGTVAGVRLIDDYAHHPTELEAAIAAGRVGNPNRVWAVFQPHLYSRTREHLEGFAAALGRADEVVLTDIYAAREEPIPGVDGRSLHHAITASGGSGEYVPLRQDVAGYLAPLLKPGDTVLVLGAGDINLVTDELLDLLRGG
ncbi:MAG: UDP-N-acetylmuramate--L-alanine ligase, partial [Acidimicrobiia bacterium]|nr:UDP-N-acetylmuramate--L-alanine ligase [Acidimicrobiia bacterium]